MIEKERRGGEWAGCWRKDKKERRQREEVEEGVERELEAWSEPARAAAQKQKRRRTRIVDSECSSFRVSKCSSSATRLRH